MFVIHPDPGMGHPVFPLICRDMCEWVMVSIKIQVDLTGGGRYGYQVMADGNIA